MEEGLMQVGMRKWREREREKTKNIQDWVPVLREARVKWEAHRGANEGEYCVISQFCRLSYNVI